MYNCDETAAYSGTALAFRDRLVLDWNKTQQTQTFSDQKRIYCECRERRSGNRGTRLTRADLSLEFLMGRALDNAMLNVGQKDTATSTSAIFTKRNAQG